ncbi:hypothetical protein [Pseudanabaena sp. PCC 6802]|uniref:hypothetical protein n=1 Tax=Pseudanabaena sp. PCC 6802 TaxID=118173 RepID=UPI00034566DF|nr:hypothetical protein [Pseudanabaena sp. PCC 6802]
MGEQGQVLVSPQIESFKQGSQSRPFYYGGQIHIEAKHEEYRKLASGLLILASHIGGFGRGSRRPLHMLDRGMRGCHWFVDYEDKLHLKYDREQWQKFFQQLRNAFHNIEHISGNYTSSPFQGGRCQDVFDRNTQIWLMRSPEQKHPVDVNNWSDLNNTRGSGLNLLYSSDNFKGEREIKDSKTGERYTIGNANVGGKFSGVPSYVWIKSIFSPKEDPYQVITIFGVDHRDRLAFARALEAEQALLVIGEMPDGDRSDAIDPTPQPNTPISSSKRQRPDPPKLKR